MILKAVTAILEALQRHGLHGAAGIRRENSCTRDLAVYFRLLTEKMPVDQLSQLAKSDGVETAKHAAEMMIKRVLRQTQPTLVGVLSTQLYLAYKDGWKAAKVLPHAKLAEADKLGDTGQKAADYAAAAAGELVQGLNKTTLETLQDAIATGIEEQLGVDGLARLLMDELEGMTKDRARMIARTEMNDAFSTATLDKLSFLQIEYKQWIAYDPCDICADNEDDGPIPVDELFSSGDSAPPAHPNCRCAVAGAAPPDGVTEED